MVTDRIAVRRGIIQEQSLQSNIKPLTCHVKWMNICMKLCTNYTPESNILENINPLDMIIYIKAQIQPK